MDILLASTFCLVLLQCSEVISAQYSITNFIRGFHYNMMSSAGHLSTINASSRVICTTLCIEVGNCTSALYDARNGNCTFYEDILQTSTDNLPTHIQYYVNKERYCTWKGFNYSQTYDICYLVDKSRISYGKTKKLCRSLNSSLIRIDTAKKQRFIESNIHEDGVTKYYYVSGDKLSGQWYFTYGPAISTFYWATDQPLDNSDFNCLMISTRMENRWFNFKCYQYGSTARICEMDIKSLIE